MNAAHARDLTNQSLKKNADRTPIDHLLQTVYRKIKVAAEAQESSIVDPFLGTRTGITPEQYEALWQALELKGYSIGRRLKKISW